MHTLSTISKMEILLSTSFAVLLVLTFSSADADIAKDDSLIIQTSYGAVQGLKFTSTWTNKTIYSFRGIPYATPPVGKLRFKDPQPPQKWAKVMDCSAFQLSCPQRPMFIDKGTSINTSEDCLYLNVFTPRLKPHDKALPVMVWVHGGGFLEGSGSYDCGPDFLVEEEVVVVTLNYRLGALGFLTLGTPDASGNSGLKDQRLALKWVQKEISNFGGDNNKITLFGESAGSASVHLHYLSPLSKDLFHRVIGESGTALGNWAVRDDGPQYGQMLAVAVNCSSPDPQSALDCLLSVDAEKILDGQALVKVTDEDKSNGEELVFIPTIDRGISAEPFIPDFPVKMIEDMQGPYVPIIMGINSDEGIMRLFAASEEEIKNTTNNLDYYISPQVKEKSTKSRIRLLTERIKQFYFKDTTPSFTNLRGYIDLGTDIIFGYFTALSARSYRKRATVYLYYFSFDGSFKEKAVESIERKLNFSGVSHAEELSYIFVREKINQSATEDSNEMKTLRKMVKMWTNFAKFGTPTVGQDPELDNVTWLPVGNVSTRYLHISSNLTMIMDDFLGASVALWDSISPSQGTALQASVLVLALTALYIAS